MRIGKKNFFFGRMPRIDSAREICAVIEAPYAKASSLTQLLVDKPDVDPLPASKSYALLPPTPPPPGNRWAEARRSLEEDAHPAREDLTNLEVAETGNLETTRYGISAGPTSDWKFAVDADNGTLAVSGQKASLAWDTHDTAAINRRGTAALIACDDAGSSRLALGQDTNTTGVGLVESVGHSLGGSEFVRADLFGAQGVGGVSISASWVSDAGARIGVGVSAILAGGTKLEPTLWSNARFHPERESQVLAQWTTKIMPVIVCDVGGSMVHIGASVRAAGYKSSQRVFQVYVDAPTLAEALAQRRGIKGVFREMLETVGAKSGPVKIPELAEVLQAKRANFLQVGESVRLVRSANMTGGLSVSIYGVRTGLFCSWTGETEIFIARPDKKHLRVTIAPKKIVSVSANIDAMIAGEVFTTASFARAMYAEYSIDTEELAACEAIDALLTKGTYPGCGLPLQSVTEPTGSDLNQRIRHEALPKGVRALNMQSAERFGSIVGIGLPKPCFLRGRTAGLSARETALGQRQVMANGDASLLINSKGTLSEREKGLAGKTSKRIEAHVRKLSMYDWRGVAETRFDGLEVELEQELSRVKGPARAQLTSKLSSMFGFNAKAVTRAGSRQTYRVKVARTFTHEALLGLSRASRIDCLRAAFTVGAGFAQLKLLVSNIAAAASLHENDTDAAAGACANLVQDYIAKYGRRSFAAVHYLARGGVDALDVEVASSAFDKPVKKSMQHQLEYGGANRAAALDRGIAEGKKLEKEAKGGLLDLEDDAILASTGGDDHKQKVDALRQVYSELQTFNRKLKERREHL